MSFETGQLKFTFRAFRVHENRSRQAGCTSGPCLDSLIDNYAGIGREVNGKSGVKFCWRTMRPTHTHTHILLETAHIVGDAQRKEKYLPKAGPFALIRHSAPPTLSAHPDHCSSIELSWGNRLKVCWIYIYAHTLETVEKKK